MMDPHQPPPVHSSLSHRQTSQDLRIGRSKPFKPDIQCDTMLQVFPKSDGCGLRSFQQPDSQYDITCRGSPGLQLKECAMQKLTTQERSQKCIKRFDQWEEDIEDHLYGRVSNRSARTNDSTHEHEYADEWVQPQRADDARPHCIPVPMDGLHDVFVESNVSGYRALRNGYLSMHWPWNLPANPRTPSLPQVEIITCSNWLPSEPLDRNRAGRFGLRQRLPSTDGHVTSTGHP
ncbi:hypothetical protein K466DRAFT_615680 [Polyporus arcularius HHB13444]|uniref:Uncharacterized protein n=1 Tax=Polyporus arcularius HHB13444 TaxID=1314778 RepID=A0A5C3NLV5_9APHY|nr:hypothetical protein K466DRAFT_615680 [Polyporus arcularius HHB13444]